MFDKIIKVFVTLFLIGFGCWALFEIASIPDKSAEGLYTVTYSYVNVHSDLNSKNDSSYEAHYGDLMYVESRVGDYYYLTNGYYVITDALSKVTEKTYVVSWDEANYVNVHSEPNVLPKSITGQLYEGDHVQVVAKVSYFYKLSDGTYVVCEALKPVE